MGPSRPSETTEYLRRLAVIRVMEGESPETVADLLGVSERSVWRWLKRWRSEGEVGLALHPGRGRPSKLTEAQTQQILDWVEQSPTDFGFTTERWTAPRLAWLIEKSFGVHLNARYLNDWARRHGITPQMPQRQARERDEKLIAGWVAHQWPRLKKRSVR